jgi:LysR family pca operon transcriptional activator
MLTDFKLGARFMSGAVGITRRQSASAPGLAAFEEIARQLADHLPGRRGA